MENLECGKVVIGQEEYGRLLEKIRTLETKLNTCAPVSIACNVRELPLRTPTNLYEDRPVFGFSNLTNENAWTCFVRLAKLVHEKPRLYYMKKNSYGNSYITSDTQKDSIPRKIEMLSQEEYRDSVDMLNEMVPIFNKYFKKNHQYVPYKRNKDSEVEMIKVSDY